MDPIKLLPVEILNQIWSQLAFNDLLSCRLVSRSWLESIIQCTEVWRPLCCPITDITTSCFLQSENEEDDYCYEYNTTRWFEHFLEEAKTKWPWKVGSFGEDVFIEDCQVQFWRVNSGTWKCQQFCCSDDYVYTTDGHNQISKYSRFGKFLKNKKLPDDFCIEEMCIVNEDIAVLCIFPNVNKVIIFNADLVEVIVFETNEERLNHGGGRVWARSPDDGQQLVNIYWAEQIDKNVSSCPNKKRKTFGKYVGVSHLVDILPGTILMPLNIGWCTESDGLVLLKFFQENIGECNVGGHDGNKDKDLPTRFYKDYIKEDAAIDIKLYKYDHTAMSRADESLSMFTNSRDIIVIIDKKVIGGKHIFCTVLIYRNERKLHRADIPLHLKHWCFTGQYLVLASITCISTIELNTGKVFIGKDYDMANNNVNIYGLKTLFNQSTLSIDWIIIDHYSHFIIYDVKNNTNLLVIDTLQRTPETIYTLNCLNSFYLYQLPDARLVIKNVIHPS